MSGSSLDYIYFSSLPNSSSQGTLYYDYKSTSSPGAKVSSSQKYYYYRSSNAVSGDYRLNRVTFVAAPNAKGSIEIPYTGYSTAGKQFEGTLVLQIGSGSGSVSYSTERSTSVLLNGGDFNEASLGATGSALDYIQFKELPSSNQGSLRYNYKSSSSTGSSASTSTKYYRSGGTTISNLTFLPADSFVGSVEVPFLGWAVDGSSFSGTMTIRVSSTGQTTPDSTTGTGEIHYSAMSGEGVPFRVSDFQRACRAITGEELSGIQLLTPAQGALYYDYQPGSDSNRKVDNTTEYYVLGNSVTRMELGKITYQATGTPGVRTLSYVGHTQGGLRYTGTVTVTVTSLTIQTIHYTCSGTPFSFLGVDFFRACSAVDGQHLDYIKFNGLPSSSQGSLYLNTNERTPVALSAQYSYISPSPRIGMIAFAPAAGFLGTVEIPYTATDENGRGYSGVIEIQVTNGVIASTFRDLLGYDWAVPAIEYLRENGVVNGYPDGTFGPANQTTRSQFIMMVCRMFGITGSGAHMATFSDVPPDAYYASALGAAMELGIINGVGNNRFAPEAPLTREQAMVILARTLRQCGRPVESAPSNVLALYPDFWDISDYAQRDMASMVQMGVIQGDGAGLLRPNSVITRAEIATVLYRTGN